MINAAQYRLCFAKDETAWHSFALLQPPRDTLLSYKKQPMSFMASSARSTSIVVFWMRDLSSILSMVMQPM